MDEANLIEKIYCFSSQTLHIAAMQTFYGFSSVLEVCKKLISMIHGTLGIFHACEVNYVAFQLFG